MKKILLTLLISTYLAEASALTFVNNNSNNQNSSSAESVVAIQVEPTELEMSSKFVGQFNLKTLSENSNPNLGVFSPVTDKFDINQDGHDDLIVGNTAMNSDSRNEPKEFSKPVLLFWDNSIKEYVDDDDVQKALPFMYFPRRIHGSVNPKTGMTHLFIADTGLDLANYDFSKGMSSLPPNCGAQNHLITYDPSSGNIDEIRLPQLHDYSHGLAATDMNGDQITDYVVLNSRYIKYPAKCSYNGQGYTNESYILYSNKNGSFDKVDLKLNYKGYAKAPTITAGVAIVDDNNDTFLLLGSEDPGHIYVFKQDSRASFTEISKVNAPKIMRNNGQSAKYSEVLYDDVDADGTEEVVASIATSDWEGQYIQLLDFSNGQLTDISEDVAQSASDVITGRDWCHHLFFNEQTAWGQPILTCTHLFAINEARSSFYTWTENKLQLAKIKSSSLSQWISRMYPVSLDQKTVFLGQEGAGKRQVNGHTFWDSIGLYLITPPKEKLAASDWYDGNYFFKLTLTNPDGHTWSPGQGFIEIKNGILSVWNTRRVLRDVDSTTDKFDTLVGQIDKNGDFQATIEFNGCGPGDCQEELILLKGNMHYEKLYGKFLNKVIAFELQKK